jgi:hypothetical protein
MSDARTCGCEFAQVSTGPNTGDVEQVAVRYCEIHDPDNRTHPHKFTHRPDPTPQQKIEAWLHCLDETGVCPTPDLDKLLRIIREFMREHEGAYSDVYYSILAIIEGE